MCPKLIVVSRLACAWFAVLLPACEPATFRTAARLPTETGTPPPRVSRTVSVRDYFFSPNPLTVAVGTRVFWTHEGVDFHSVLFDAPISFYSGQLARSDRVQRQFNSPGVFTYRCTFHDNMVAVVHVQEAD